ncbi:NmrA family NAD(P)-binding protein [Streptomyces sp. NPDC048518]|uniref:NmrA family NAD(P)-binding protein n=1 Tax=Streptomyces sp. NPDC048518 TaxID=3155029 RepID=UPI0033CB6ED3
MRHFASKGEVAPGDIGVIAAAAFDAPADYLGRTIEIAGDEATGPQMAEIFGRAAGRPPAGALRRPAGRAGAGCVRSRPAADDRGP